MIDFGEKDDLSATEYSCHNGELMCDHGIKRGAQILKGILQCVTNTHVCRNNQYETLMVLFLIDCRDKRFNWQQNALNITKHKA